MRIPLFAVMVVVAVSSVRAEETIPLKTLADIKASTVFVKASVGPFEANGSGFVIRVDGEAVYVATNHHVVSSPKNLNRIGKLALTLVFGSGTKSERVAQGEILASDPARDLAILKVTGLKEIPKPIDYSKVPELVETMPVFTFGFPFGRMLSTSKGSPAITVGRGTVSSIRTDDAGDVAFVQIDGALNPGNSGGPVVSSQGNLIGIAVATIRGAQQIGLVIPQDQLVKMLDGRVGASSLRTKTLAEDKAELDIEVALIDPLSRIKEVAVLYVAGDVTRTVASPLPGRGREPLPGAQRVPLAISGAKATGTLSLTLPKSGDRRVTCQVVYTNGAEKPLYLQPVLHNLAQPDVAENDDMLSPAPRRAGVVRGRMSRPRSPANDPGRSESFTYSGRGGKLESFTAVAVGPQVKVVFTATPSGFLKQYAYPSFELQGSYKLPGPATQLALDAMHQKLFAIVTTRQDLKFSHPSHQPSGAGDLHVYDVKGLLSGKDTSATELTPESTVSLGANVSRMQLSPTGQHLYLLQAAPDAKSAPGKLIRIDTTKNVADIELDLEQGAETFCVAPGGKALYVAVSPQGHAHSSRSGVEEGKIFMVEPGTFEVIKTAQIELDPGDIQANEKGQVYVAGGSNQHTVIAVVDMKKTRAIVTRWKGVYMGAIIRLSSDQKRLYIGSRGVSPASVASWVLPQRADGMPAISRISDGPDAPLGGEIFLTPDDAFLLTRFGAVVPLGASKAPESSAPSMPKKSATPKPRRLAPR